MTAITHRTTKSCLNYIARLGIAIDSPAVFASKTVANHVIEFNPNMLKAAYINYLNDVVCTHIAETSGPNLPLKLEAYLRKPRSFRGPLADYVARKADFVNFINNEISYVEFGMNDFGPVEQVKTDTLV